MTAKVLEPYSVNESFCRSVLSLLRVPLQIIKKRNMEKCGCGRCIQTHALIWTGPACNQCIGHLTIGRGSRILIAFNDSNFVSILLLQNYITKLAAFDVFSLVCKTIEI